MENDFVSVATFSGKCRMEMDMRVATVLLLGATLVLGACAELAGPDEMLPAEGAGYHQSGLADYCDACGYGSGRLWWSERPAHTGAGDHIHNAPDRRTRHHGGHGHDRHARL